MFNNFFSENHFVYEIMWKNFVELGRPVMKIWHMRIAFCIPKATHTHPHRLCNTHFFPTETMVAGTHFNVTLFVNCLSCSYVTFVALRAGTKISIARSADLQDMRLKLKKEAVDSSNDPGNHIPDMLKGVLSLTFLIYTR